MGEVLFFGEFFLKGEGSVEVSFAFFCKNIKA